MIQEKSVITKFFMSVLYFRFLDMLAKYANRNKP